MCVCVCVCVHMCVCRSVYLCVCVAWMCCCIECCQRQVLGFHHLHFTNVFPLYPPAPPPTYNPTRTLLPPPTLPPFVDHVYVSVKVIYLRTHYHGNYCTIRVQSWMFEWPCSLTVYTHIGFTWEGLGLLC